MKRYTNPNEEKKFINSVKKKRRSKGKMQKKKKKKKKKKKTGRGRGGEKNKTKKEKNMMGERGIKKNVKAKAFVLTVGHTGEVTYTVQGRVEQLRAKKEKRTALNRCPSVIYFFFFYKNIFFF
eukprot:TRINITY_DN3740_c0_g1_i1.p1 TRINITY_DN3740_c0_g1~~TRINITY_DN3740_c0_g1_i1.p1  ORF type:complete len:123 (-),score=33.89 TRINITY_DN3740_c0_g1_i1:78-446(-)